VRGGWPLATLLDLAARRERAARADLAAALAREVELRGQREAAQVLAASASAAERAATERLRRAGPTAAAVRDAAHHLARLRDEAARLAERLRAAAVALAAATREAEARRRTLSGARGEVEALERHRGRWRASGARRRGRAEEAAADDLVSARPRAER
jgi:hypothetical protein